ATSRQAQPLHSTHAQTEPTFITQPMEAIQQKTANHTPDQSKLILTSPSKPSLKAIHSPQVLRRLFLIPYMMIKPIFIYTIFKVKDTSHLWSANGTKRYDEHES